MDALRALSPKPKRLMLPQPIPLFNRLLLAAGMATVLLPAVPATPFPLFNSASTHNALQLLILDPEDLVLQ